MREVIVPCRDLDAAIAAFEAVGFALELVLPADDPALAVVSRDGARIRLVRGDAGDVRDEDALRVALARPALRPALVVTIARDRDWHRGRAGMTYRDLVPDRLGGWLVASHVRIADGGPVADYVHFHDLRAQILYCRAGSAQLVYEDQGEPFVMHPGDCIVQPPRIRHRVLGCSPGLEVIEVAMPAAHATYADRALALPTAIGDPERRWSGQRFAWLRGDELPWTDVPGGHRVRAFDLSRALGDGWAARRLDLRGALARSSSAVAFGFVLAGRAELVAGGARHALGRDDAFCIPPGEHVTLAGSPDADVLELELPSHDVPVPQV
ncbi:MAG TPA: hypothetical protein VLX92_21530 [Kofleriaceae bacterium]|nr:hypothetical protein [Kofleriaceae bacterium]